MSEPEWPLWSAEHPEPPGPAQPEAGQQPPAAPHPSREPSAAGTPAAAPAAGAPASPGCPACGRPVHPAALFCEACGSPLVPTQPAAAAPAEPPAEARSTQTRRLGARVSQVASCPSCGGTVGADGYCQTCGAKAPSARDHFTLSPADWVGGVCDRGRQHHRNEDAMALWAQADRAVLVVCDGVSTSVDSDVAAMTAAERARDVLVARSSTGVAGDASQDAAFAQALAEAVTQANEAVVAGTPADSANAGSATIAAAVVAGDRVHYANLGDSRVYFLGATEQLLLSLDDSMAQAFIAEGMPREEAEALPRAHAITKWLGRDAVDTAARTGVLQVREPGWLVVCSDGLWNYASAPEVLAEQLAAATTGTTEATAVARQLVEWANAQGGHDNVTVALARIAPAATAPAADPASTSVEDQRSVQPGKEQPEHG